MSPRLSFRLFIAATLAALALAVLYAPREAECARPQPGFVLIDACS